MGISACQTINIHSTSMHALVSLYASRCPSVTLNVHNWGMQPRNGTEAPPPKKRRWVFMLRFGAQVGRTGGGGGDSTLLSSISVGSNFVHVT